MEMSRFMVNARDTTVQEKGEISSQGWEGREGKASTDRQLAGI